jgi:hypothetical protein
MKGRSEEVKSKTKLRRLGRDEPITAHGLNRLRGNIRVLFPHDGMMFVRIVLFRRGIIDVFCRPYVTRCDLSFFPTVKTLGYFRTVPTGRKQIRIRKKDVGKIYLQFL